MNELVERLSRLKHDLGKAISFQLRFLGGSLDPAALREALLQDLGRTRRGPSGESDAVEVWSALRPGLAELAPDDPELAALDARMAVVADTLAALRAGTDAPDDARRGAEAALDVTRLCRAWWERRRG